MALESRLAALCFARSSRATRASCASNLHPSGLEALGSAESRQKPRSWRCTQPRAVKATAGVGVLGKMASITRTTAACDTRCWRGELGVRHVDLRREATTVIANATSTMLYDTAVWFLVWVCGRVGVCFVVG